LARFPADKKFNRDFQPTGKYESAGGEGEVKTPKGSGSRQVLTLSVRRYVPNVDPYKTCVERIPESWATGRKNIGVRNLQKKGPKQGRGFPKWVPDLVPKKDIRTTHDRKSKEKITKSEE